MKIPIAIQLYTLREDTSKDFIGTLEKVASLGYDGVEFAGYGDIAADKMKSHLDRLGLKVAGSHVSLEDLTTKLNEIINYNIKIKNKNIILCWSKWENENELNELTDKLKDIATKLKEKGLNLYYHNHDHEFELIHNKFGLDQLYSSLDESLLKMELDTHWVRRAGIDPVEYMKKYGHRCSLVHIKDMIDVDGEKDFAAIGEGTMNISAIIDTANKIGAKWVIVENDAPKPNGIENVTISINNLKKMSF